MKIFITIYLSVGIIWGIISTYILLKLENKSDTKIKDLMKSVEDNDKKIIFAIIGYILFNIFVWPTAIVKCIKAFTELSKLKKKLGK